MGLNPTDRLADELERSRRERSWEKATMAEGSPESAPPRKDIFPVARRRAVLDWCRCIR
jgi:hypothetical protein